MAEPVTMPTTVNGLNLRRVMGRDLWQPPRRYGLDGWLMVANDRDASIVVSTAVNDDDGLKWTHASIARTDRMPVYDDIARLHRAAFGDAWAYQVFAPSDRHINIHDHALHLWGRADGQPALPDFGRWGSI